MKATEAKLLNFVQNSPQFVIQIQGLTCNGDEKIGLSTLDELSNVTVRLRQSYEGQMGDECQA